MQDQLTLSRRERQILDIIYTLGRATAADVLERIPDPPTYTTVRGLLRVLETKGHVKHADEGGRYVYFPSLKKRQAGRSVLAHVVETFFDNSPSRALAALLGSEKRLSDEELGELEELIEKAKKRR